jgi:amino acid transporter
MRIIGCIIIILSVIILIWSIRQTNAVHSYNMENYSETPKNDLGFIISGILGGMLAVVGFVMMIQPAKRPSS